MSRRTALLALAGYLLLTLLAWGLFAFDAGLWQDDASSLGRALRAAERGEGGFLAAGATQTRRLKSAVYAVATRVPDPLLFLHLVAGAVWLGQGLLADRLARRLFAPRAWIGFLAGALTLCATGDLLTGSLVGIGYQLSILAFAGALLLLLRFCDEGGRHLLAASALLLACSLWASDGVLTSFALVPLLLASWGVPRRRMLWAGAAWLGAALPYIAVVAVIEWPSPYSYLHTAQLSLTPGEWLARTWRLFAYNFTPWRWLSHPPAFAGANPPPVVPRFVYWGAALLACAVFVGVLLWLARHDAEERPPPRGRWRGFLVLGALALLALAVNAAFARIHFAEAYYRTHLVSRLWSSLLLAGISARLLGGARGGRLLAVLLPAAFVGLGTWGGIERQDHYLAASRRHRAELASIVAAAPGLRAEASLVLHAAADPAFRATEAEYLARNWAVLLYRDASLVDRTFLWSPERLAECRAGTGGLRCWREKEAACLASGGCSGTTIPYDRLVVLTVDARSGRFRLVKELGELLPGELPAAAGDYAPTANLTPRRASRFVRSLLVEPPLLGRLLAPPAVAGADGR